jgi:hypothetical protein
MSADCFMIAKGYAFDTTRPAITAKSDAIAVLIDRVVTVGRIAMERTVAFTSSKTFCGFGGFCADSR